MARTQPLAATAAAHKKPLAATEVDRRLRNALRELQLAERNAVLWFAEVLKRRLFWDLGFSSVYQYAGEALGFSPPRTAQFIRLCESLEGLPALKSSVATGEVSWTKAREVAKVATPQTESAWVDLARRESRRKLERRVRMAQTRSRARRRDGGRQLGLAGGEMQLGVVTTDAGPGSQAARPSAFPADPLGAPRADSPSVQALSADADGMPLEAAFAEIPATLSLRFTPEQYARYEAILEQLRKRGERGPREELFLAGLEALLVEAGAGTADSEPPREEKSSSAHGAGSPSTRTAAAAARDAEPVSPRNSKPAYQIVVQQCEDCGRARVQTSRGAKPIDPAAAEAMRCDARVLRPGERSHSGETNHLGETNRPSGRNRATIPPSVRREVMARDGYRCRTPGCGSARFLEVHHVVPRAAGGLNRPGNLVTLCSACHRLAHSHPLHGSPLARGFHGSTHDHQPQRIPFARRPHGSSPRQPPGSNPTVGGNGADHAGGGDPTVGGNGAAANGNGADHAGGGDPTVSGNGADHAGGSTGRSTAESPGGGDSDPRERKRAASSG